MIDSIEAEGMQTLGMTGTKWDLFVAATNLFAEKGYANVSVRDIADTLNVKAPGIYYHFESKDAILAQIYEFFRVNYEAFLPNLDELVASIPNTPPDEIFKKLPFEVLPIDIPLTRIVLDERNRDERACELAKRVFHDYPKKYIKTILNTMIELGKIEPLDVDSFAILFSCLDLGFLYTNGDKGGLSVSLEDRRKAHETLFGMIRQK
jgi:AcrR family transcriptional regulator